MAGIINAKSIMSRGATETVTLEGGPHGGTTMSWSGGDLIRLFEQEAFGLKLAPTDGEPPASNARYVHVYRRAMYLRRTFTYQGPEPV